MWCDLVMGPARVKSGRKTWALIWDNVAAHDVQSVLDVYKEWGIIVLFLPKYMTDLLQPVDLVPNVPIKAHTRSDRCAKLYDYFQSWRRDTDDAIRLQRPLPAYLPPPATMMAGGMALISSIFAGQFLEESYMESARRCFVSVGLAPREDGSYVKVPTSTGSHVLPLFEALLPHLQQHSRCPVLLFLMMLSLNHALAMTLTAASPSRGKTWQWRLCQCLRLHCQ